MAGTRNHDIAPHERRKLWSKHVNWDVYQSVA